MNEGNVPVYNSKYVFDLFVGFWGAFEQLNWARIMEKLKHVDCRKADLCMSYFRHRSACAVGENDTAWK